MYERDIKGLFELRAKPCLLKKHLELGVVDFEHTPLLAVTAVLCRVLGFQHTVLAIQTAPFWFIMVHLYERKT